MLKFVIIVLKCQKHFQQSNMTALGSLRVTDIRRNRGSYFFHKEGQSNRVEVLTLETAACIFPSLNKKACILDQIQQS